MIWQLFMWQIHLKYTKCLGGRAGKLNLLRQDFRVSVNCLFFALVTFVFHCRAMRHAHQVTGFMEFSKTKESISLTESPRNSINSPERAVFPKQEMQWCIPLLCFASTSPEQWVFFSLTYCTYLFLHVGASRKSFCVFLFLELMRPGHWQWSCNHPNPDHWWWTA